MVELKDDCRYSKPLQVEPGVRSRDSLGTKGSVEGEPQARQEVLQVISSNQCPMPTLGRNGQAEGKDTFLRG